MNHSRKKTYLLVILLFIFGYLHADEFVVRSFKPAPEDLSAIQFAYADVNSEQCAIIKVRTDLRNLAFDSGKNLARDVEFKNGDYWLYVSPDEKRLTVIKDGFITLHYQIKIPIRPSKVYVLEITNKDKGLAETGSMIINTVPEGAEVKIRELSGLEFVTPAELTNYPAFPYFVEIAKSRYKPIDTVLTIHPLETITHNLTLVPRWGDLIIHVEPVDAEIYIDGEFLGTGNQELISEKSGITTGMHTITVVRDKYLSSNKTIEIKRGNNGTLEFNLRPRNGYLGIDVKPADAKVLLNGKQINSVPFGDSLLKGTYDISISREGYRSINKTVELSENQRIDLFEEMEHTREVRIVSDPPGAAIYLRDNYMGTTPENILLTYGTNTLTLRKENFKDLNRRIEVTGTTNRLGFSLKPSKYQVMINTSPQGANVYLNNNHVKETPADLKLSYGTYRLKLEKYGYFRKRRNIKVTFDNQNFNFTLKSLRHIRVGVVRGADSWGGEFTYAEDLFGMTFGYFQPPKIEFSHTVQHENIEPSDFYELVPGESVGRQSNIDSSSYKIIVKGHMFLNKAPTFSFVLGLSMGKIHYADIYRAEANYEHIFDDDFIREGEYYSIARKGNFKVSPIAGISLRIFRYFYAGAEYWFLTEKDTQLFLNGGICYPLR